MNKIFSIFFCLFLSVSVFSQSAVLVSQAEKTLGSQWAGKKAAYLGDSMTDPNTSYTTRLYWQYLKELLDLDHVVYARSGFQWTGIKQMAQRLYADHGDSIDAVFIWAGTNEYNHGVPIGDFFTETMQQTNHNGTEVMRKFRTPIFSDSTFCGRINMVMDFLKTHYPTKQIVIFTPIHRGFATFGSRNVQPAENFANSLGLFLETYVDVLKRAGEIWSVPVIDLYSLSGLYPLSDQHAIYFANAERDLLHPNALGHYRIAKTIQYQLLTLPSGFYIDLKTD